MIVLGLDTATPDTVVALITGDADEPLELRHAPAPGERPGHAAQLLPLANALLDRAGLTFADVERIGVGVGPGTFTGLRIGVATARALAQGTTAQTVPVSTLRALAGAADHDGPVLAVLDARRGEAFAAGYHGDDELIAPVAVKPDRLASLVERPSVRGQRWLAVGDGAVQFRDQLEPAAIAVPADGHPSHRVSAVAICRLASRLPPVPRDALVPDYVRLPDAVETRLRTAKR